jgi:hypothetical protein
MLVLLAKQLYLSPLPFILLPICFAHSLIKPHWRSSSSLWPWGRSRGKGCHISISVYPYSVYSTLVLFIGF